ncbi:MAG: 50S ribosomal protein L11 methyltransferase, partial [Roseiflexaceae bacterium]|nr:50S ribosomal protein L11 methyltransferase [Roseiflexaceae bacterium]
MSWIELAVDVDHEAAEPVSDLLAHYGYNGGVVLDQPIIPGTEGSEFSFDEQRPVTLRTFIPADQWTEEARSRIEQALWHLGRIRPVGELRVRPLEEQDWANAWKQHYKIQRIGQRTVIVPSWLEYAPKDGDIVLRLDPGMAFGTGLHPTTQLCLIFLEQYLAPGMRVLDLGCGSGVLAIAAAHLGASSVLGLDTDPIATDATMINAQLNGVEAIVQAATGSLGAGSQFGHWLGVPTAEESPAAVTVAPDGGYDLLVANIIAKVLVAVAADMARALKPGGLLISSGIIAEREDEVALAYAAAGLERIARRQQGDWVGL